MRHAEEHAMIQPIKNQFVDCVYIGTYIHVDTKATHINVQCSPTISKSSDDYQEADVGLFSCCNILHNWRDRRSGLNR